MDVSAVLLHNVHGMHLLLIEDERKVASFIQRGLEAEHYSVDVEYDGEAGLTRLWDGNYDLVILDVNLPKRDGFAVLRELRARQMTVPVLLLTARDTIADKVAGLDQGPTTISPSHSLLRNSLPASEPCFGEEHRQPRPPC